MTSPVWLITGASSGFGLSLVLQALQARHHVVGAVRSKAKSAEAVERIVDAGGQVVEMDMTAAQPEIAARVAEAEAVYGRIDYLVNNAGYSLMGPLQHFTEAEVKLQFQTNVFGPLFTTQAALPGMRRRRSGTIINISSVAGQDALATCGAYGGSKSALEGISEALAKEVAEFGISVLIVEPGAYRTNFLHAMRRTDGAAEGAAVADDYRGTMVEAVADKFAAMKGRQPGDPDKAAARIFQAATGDLRGRLLRLPLGMDAVERIEGKLRKLGEDLAQARRLEEASSTALPA